jgi:hypothetical protein
MPNIEPGTRNLEPGTWNFATSLYFVRMSRTYVRVIVLETAIIVALVIFGRLFS